MMGQPWAVVALLIGLAALAAPGTADHLKDPRPVDCTDALGNVVEVGRQPLATFASEFSPRCVLVDAPAYPTFGPAITFVNVDRFTHIPGTWPDGGECFRAWDQLGPGQAMTVRFTHIDGVLLAQPTLPDGTTSLTDCTQAIDHVRADGALVLRYDCHLHGPKFVRALQGELVVRLG